jgi:hypothetical protein
MYNDILSSYGLICPACRVMPKQSTSASGMTRALLTLRYITFVIYAPHSSAPFPAAFPFWNKLSIFASLMDSLLAPIGLPLPAILNSS